MPITPSQRLILRAVHRDVYPMVIRLVAVLDCVDLPDFDAIFHAVLGWEGGTCYAFRVHGEEFTSFRRQARSTTLRDFRLRTCYEPGGGWPTCVSSGALAGRAESGMAN